LATLTRTLAFPPKALGMMLNADVFDGPKAQVTPAGGGATHESVTKLLKPFRAVSVLV